MIARVTVHSKLYTASQVDAAIEKQALKPIYLTDSQDLDAIREHFGNRASLDDISGAIVAIDNGDYASVYVTYSSRPYSLDAKYQRVTLILYSRK